MQTTTTTPEPFIPEGLRKATRMAGRAARNRAAVFGRAACPCRRIRLSRTAVRARECDAETLTIGARCADGRERTARFRWSGATGTGRGLKVSS